MSDDTSLYHLLRRRLFMLLCMCLAVFGPIFGQSFQLSFKHLTTESGLSQSVNYHLVKDATGFVWIGSEDGLNRFDGNNCKVFAPDIKLRSISGKNILGIVSAANGNLWVGTENGLQCRTSRGPNFKVVKSNDSDGKSPAIPLAEYDGTVLVLYPTSGKLILIDSTQNSLGLIPQRLPVKDIERVFAVKSFIGNDKTLFLLADQRLFSFSWNIVNVNPVKSYNRIIESKLGSTAIQAICAQGDSLVWLATDKGLYQFFPSSGRLLAVRNLDGRSLRDIQSMAIGMNGILFAGTFEDGCLVIDPKRQKIIQHFRNNLTDQSSLGGNSVLSIMTDTLSNVWMAVDLVGVDFANSQKRKFLRWPEAPSNVNTFIRPEIYAMAVDSSGNIWTGNKLRGITVFDEQKKFLREYHGKQKGGPLPSESIHHLLVDKQKEIWVATSGGLMRHPQGSSVWEQAKTVGNELLRNPQYMLQNSSDELLCLAEGGVWRKVPDRNAVFEKIIGIPADVQLPSFFYQDSILGICIPPLGRFQKKDGVWTRVANFNIAAVNSMLWDTILQSHWLGTDNGLILLDGKTKQIVTYAESDGLESSHINGMILDFYGNLWFGTNKGIIRFKVRKEDFLTKSKARNYNISDGLQDNSFGRFAACVDRSGNFLFGGLKGFNSFDPLRLFDYGHLPKIAITGIEINDRDTVPAIKTNLLDEISLMPFQTSFAIYFSGIDFADPGSIMFRTRLDGYDREWITKKEGLVRYSNLKPGTYVLKIKAANADGQWTPESRNLTITVKPPIWNYWFVKLFAFLLLVVTTYLLVHANTERQLERQKLVFEKQQAITDERSRIAADMHDDLGSGLSMITLMSDIASVKAKDPDQAEAIRQIGVTSNELIDKMGEIIWTLNSKNDTIESLLRYIRQFASKLFDVTDIQWTMNVQDNMREMTCPGKLRRNIFLTSKEALHNIVKHSKARNANIQASIHENVLIISITDNGKGIEPHKINQFGNGMTNMRKRIEDIGGQFSIISEQGTEILIRVPIDLFDSIVKEE